MSVVEGVGSSPRSPLRAGLRAVPESAAGGRELLRRARELLEALSSASDGVGELTEAEVTELAATGVALTRAGEALAVTATVEAVDRGTTQSSTSANTAQWVRALGPGMEPGQAQRIADVAEQIAARDGLVRTGPPRAEVLADAEQPSGDGAGTDGPDLVARLVEADPTGRLLLAEAVASGAVSVRGAHRAMRETPRVRRLIPSASAGEVLSWFLALGDEATDRDRRMLTRQLVARYDPDQLCRDESTEQSRESLTMYDLPCGMVRLTADLSKGNAAVLRQALAKLSAPRPTPCQEAGSGDPNSTAEQGSRGVADGVGAAEQGTATEAPRDTRSGATRQAHALMELVHAATDHMPGAGRGSITGNAKVVVTVDLETLVGAIGALGGALGRSIGPAQTPGAGMTPYGDLLDMTTVRRIACDAGIIPAVLGSDSEPLDVGREERLFTGRLRTAVVLRDRECSFPGCDRPPDWCEVHHLVPWWAGGPTTLDNGALLCERHHTIVHRDGLTGSLADGRIVWDLRPGRLNQWPRAG